MCEHCIRLKNLYATRETLKRSVFGEKRAAGVRIREAVTRVSKAIDESNRKKKEVGCTKELGRGVW